MSEYRYKVLTSQQVYHLNIENRNLEVEQFDEAISCLALRKNGLGVSKQIPNIVKCSDLCLTLQLACAAAQGFALLEGGSSLAYISCPLSTDHVPHVRFNDGACDSKGRFFAGTIFNKERGIAGKLYKYDPADDRCSVVDDGPFTVQSNFWQQWR